MASKKMGTSAYSHKKLNSANDLNKLEEDTEPQTRT